MPNWKKVVTSGSKAVLQTLEVNPQPSSATTTHGVYLWKRKKWRRFF